VLCYDFTYGQEMGLPEVRYLIVLLESMRRSAIERAHHGVAHKAVEATVAKLHKTVYFASMYRWVNETLRRCETCQVKKGAITNWLPFRPFQKISIDLVSEVVAMLEIRQSSTPSYNPKSNPVEHQHPSLGDTIKALTEGDQHAWEDYLPHALFAMHTSICVSTGLRPSPPCLEQMCQRLWRWSSELLPLCRTT
jgi:hypothetical protein